MNAIHEHLSPTSQYLNVEQFFRNPDEIQLRRDDLRTIEEIITVIDNFINHHCETPKLLFWTAETLEKGQAHQCIS
jgi:hypothetical protein